MPSPQERHPVIYCFDDVVIERDNFRVLKRDQARTLEPRAFDLLIYLVEHRGRVVEKGELFDQVWKQSFVTDSALTQEIRQIRRAIGDDADAPQYIETIPKRGYRFIAEVHEAGTQTVVTGQSQVFDSLVVLPFANLNADPEQDYFVEGITDLLTTRLGKLRTLKVISRTSAMQYKDTRKLLPQIARELKVKAVVEGAVLRVGERMRITVQLIEAATDRHVWAESYERDLRDILSLQNEVAYTVAGRIRVSLTPEEQARLTPVRPVNPEAYEAYLKGRYFYNKWSPGCCWKAIEYFQAAIDKDPNYAAAWAGLADTYGQIGAWGLAAPREVIPRIRAAVLKALELDDTLDEAHSVLGKLKFYYDWDWVTAEAEFRQAIELNPNDTLARISYAFGLADMGRSDEGLAMIRRAWELDPRSLVLYATIGWHLYVARQYEQAIRQWQKTLEMDSGFFLAHLMLWRVFSLEGRFDEALSECQKVYSLMGNTDVLQALKTGYARSGYRGAMSRAADQLSEQLKEKYINPSGIALLYVHAEEKDQAITWLERACEERDLNIHAIGTEPDWESLHAEPRFRNLLKQLGRPLIVPQSRS